MRFCEHSYINCCTRIEKNVTCFKETKSESQSRINIYVKVFTLLVYIITFSRKQKKIKCKRGHGQVSPVRDFICSIRTYEGYRTVYTLQKYGNTGVCGPVIAAVTLVATVKSFIFKLHKFLVCCAVMAEILKFFSLCNKKFIIS